ncbi:TetR/AcrR family transcriptional regulator [Bifidobacterium simiiventris]|uniref:TetR/AcrR family transcriptional regulator n=1 Tax=Bifidobacterium simiiventris TaxID=2834434 RepID=UPI001C5A3D08|nr:TetR/AcrR family transcriptional regulator [Bifidobacterium simiiventris]MBW3078424.1 TetR family transcriptional regulator [Bifidobacterium simiiventris]
MGDDRQQIIDDQTTNNRPADHRPTADQVADRRLATLHRNNEESNAFVRDCIEGALIQLMKTKPFESITVTDIARRAGVSRNAYYRNYASKEAILDGFLATIFEEINRSLLRYDPMAQTREAWLAILAGVRRIALQYRLILQAGQGDRIRERMRASMNHSADRHEIGPRYAAAFWAGAICETVDQWVLAGMDAPDEELADVMTDLMLHGVATAGRYHTGCQAG